MGEKAKKKPQDLVKIRDNGRKEDKNKEKIFKTLIFLLTAVEVLCIILYACPSGQGINQSTAG